MSTRAWVGSSRSSETTSRPRRDSTSPGTRCFRLRHVTSATGSNRTSPWPALPDEHLISAGQPVRWQLTGGQAVQPAESGVVFVADGIQPGQRYTVWSYAPDIAPDQLIGLQPAYPRAVARYLEVLPGVAVPPFGAVNRERRIAALFAEQEGTPNERVCAQHERLYEQAQDVVGSAPTPYLAVVGLEQWFRSTGGFSYNELPPRPSGTEPPLVEFVLTGQEGYCQHYAGAMALMLRMLGIPACVAAGFVSGDLDEDTGVWTVTDRDAHTWVEVWFPTFGRLSFDPTPGRGNLGEAYSVSSEAFALGTEGGGSVCSVRFRSAEAVCRSCRRARAGSRPGQWLSWSSSRYRHPAAGKARLALRAAAGA